MKDTEARRLKARADNMEQFAVAGLALIAKLIDRLHEFRYAIPVDDPMWTEFENYAASGERWSKAIPYLYRKPGRPQRKLKEEKLSQLKHLSKLHGREFTAWCRAYSVNPRTAHDQIKRYAEQIRNYRRGKPGK